MLLRLEKHFKAEQAARVKAEELMNAAITAESESKVALEDALRKQAQHLAELETERVAIKTERDALEAMRQAFENELNQARTEVAKAQRAVEGNGKLRANEMTVKSKHIGQLQGELDKLRKELDKRTEELERWRRQAHTAAAGVHEAKEELISRKRELEHTKKKMDRVLDDLLRAGVDIHAPMSSISHATHATTTTTTGRKQQTNSHPGATRRQTQERLKVAPMAASADNQRSWAAATVPPPSKPMAKASTAPLPVSKGARMLATVPNGHPVANGLKPKNGTKPMAAGQTMGGGGNGNGRPAPISMPAPAHGGGSPVKLAPLMTHSPVSSNGNLGSPVRQSHAPAALRDASFPTPKLAETTTMYVMRRQAEKQEEKKLRPKMPDRFLQGRANAEVHLAMVSKFAA